jgi:DNA-binding transcriptional regulator YdaS (Cro superfamily)
MAGGQASLARAIGITQAAVWNWTKRGKRVPVKHLAAVERATGIARAELRPDIFGA